jgi:hypothetical protein
MRRACLDCVYKHLASARVLEPEFRMGYPILKLDIVGNLDQAAIEAFKESQRLAMVIRQHRLNWYADPLKYDVPYEALAQYVEAVKAMPEHGPVLELTDECLEGIARDGQGGLVFDMDTRA